MFYQLLRVFLLITSLASYSQSPTYQPLPPPINMPMGAELSPSLTGNGRTIVYEAAIGEDNRSVVSVSYQKGGVWSRPEAIPGISTKADKIFNGAHFVTFDGNFIFFSSNRYGGVGSNDVYFIEKSGNSWTPPVNLGKPINSTAAETDPSISPDGKWLYFVRNTDKKTTTGKPCGKIFVAERKGKGAFGEPKELPSPINQGCDCNPRILADNVTLVFASERPGGKGGYDQYKSELQDDLKWSKPVPLDFINTKDDELYISIPAGGDFLYTTAKGKVATDIVRTRIPLEHHPKNVLFISGKVKDANVMYVNNENFLNAKIGLQKVKKNKTTFIGTDEGNYALLLPEKETYHLTFSAKGYSFQTLTFDLDTLKRFKELKTDIDLHPLKNNTVFNLDNKNIIDHNGKINPSSEILLYNIKSLLTENPTLTIEISSHTDSVSVDSVAHPQLTEIAHDTVISVNGNSIAFKTLFHNDITKKEAKAIHDFLVRIGVPENRFTTNGYGSQKPCNLNPAFGVKCFNKRIEIRVMKE